MFYFLSWESLSKLIPWSHTSQKRAGYNKITTPFASVIFLVALEQSFIYDFFQFFLWFSKPNPSKIPVSMCLIEYQLLVEAVHNMCFNN